MINKLFDNLKDILDDQWICRKNTVTSKCQWFNSNRLLMKLLLYVSAIYIDSFAIEI